jgi:hypothetical protein
MVKRYDFLAVLFEVETFETPLASISDLKNTTGAWGAGEREPAEKVAVLGAGTLSLVNVPGWLSA